MNTRQKARAWDLLNQEVGNALMIGYHESPVLTRLVNVIRFDVEKEDEEGQTIESRIVEKIKEINKEENKVIAVSDATEEILSFIRVLGFDDIADEFYKVYWR